MPVKASSKEVGDQEFQCKFSKLGHPSGWSRRPSPIERGEKKNEENRECSQPFSPSQLCGPTRGSSVSSPTTHQRSSLYLDPTKEEKKGRGG